MNKVIIKSKDRSIGFIYHDKEKAEEVKERYSNKYKDNPQVRVVSNF